MYMDRPERTIQAVKMLDVSSILVQSNAAHDHHSDTFLDEFGYAKLREGDISFFGQIRNQESEDKTKRHFAVYYKCAGRGKLWRHAKPDDLCFFYLRNDLSIHEELDLIKDIVDERNKAYAFSLSFRHHVVRVFVANEPEGIEPEDNLALVLGPAEASKIKIVWLIDGTRALEYINNDSKTRRPVPKT